MKKKLLALLSLFSMCSGVAQQQYSDSLKQAVLSATEDSSKVYTLTQLSAYYSFLYPDSAMYYADEAIEFSKKRNYSFGEALGLLRKGEAFDRVADFPSALTAAYNSLEIAKKLDRHRLLMMSKCYHFIAHLNHMTGNNKDAAEYYHLTLDLINQSGEDKNQIYYIYFQLALEMRSMDNIDSAFYYLDKGKKYLPILKAMRIPTPWLQTGIIYNTVGKIDSANKYFREGLNICEEQNALFLSAAFYNVLGSIYFQKNMRDSSIYYTRKSLLLSRKNKYKVFEMESSGSLAYIYNGVNSDSALKYVSIMLAARDEIEGISKLRQFQQISFQDEKKQRDIEEARSRLKNQAKMYVLFAAIGIFLIIALIFWRNSKQRKKANLLLKLQKEKVELTLAELKSMQAQLIQSEKMASLGELTAGIAHEIQNPLNFVNNFSDLNKELVEELQQTLKDGTIEEAVSISTAIKENEEKINQHGKRAEAIVKGMLQHSRSSSGVKEQTDINALCDEYSRLAYQGFRAKDKLFSASLKLDLDESIGNINTVGQDIGRVILNLINNAFYAVAEKQKLSSINQALPEYEPTVTIATQRQNGFVEIKVKDNGIGISRTVLDKIFQPFFTTKPSGQGTGLGLSLSYDIVKSHGGELKVVTKEGIGSEFIIQLP